MSSASDFNLNDLPPIFIIPTHLQTDDLHDVEDVLYEARGRLSYRASEARIFIGKISHKKRAAFELRSRGLWTLEESIRETTPSASKRRRLNDEKVPIDRSLDGTEAGVDQGSVSTTHNQQHGDQRSTNAKEPIFPDLTDHVIVLKLEWLNDSSQRNSVLPIEPYLVYYGKIVPKPPEEHPTASTKDSITYIKALPGSLSRKSVQADPTERTNAILERAKADANENPLYQSSLSSAPFHRRKFGTKNITPYLTHPTDPPKLHRTTTSEYGDLDLSKLPSPPQWLLEEHPRPTYSCLRDTPPIDTSPNRYFIAQLEKIKEARVLTLDEIGVRAYSTSIASLAAYPHRITSPLEVTRLPGCNDKIAALWVEWHQSKSLSNHTSTRSSLAPEPAATAGRDEDEETTNTTTNATQTQDDTDQDAQLDPDRTIALVRTLANDETLNHLRLFYQVWGVGAETARKFYLDNGWQDLDDVIEHGWHTSLNRAQQIGLKFHDEFQLTIPRAEVEHIARTVLRHARLCRAIPEQYWTNDVTPGANSSDKTCLGDPRDFVAAIVGGYRRGKAHSGDVDVILSHRDDRMTKDLVVDLVKSLETEGWVTHTLTLNTATSDRDMASLPFRADGFHSGSSFDSLDKALCVWQDPRFDDYEDDDDDDVTSNQTTTGGEGEGGSGSGNGDENKGKQTQTQPPTTSTTTTTKTKTKKNPNVHRRVDIIVSAWRTVGCAVMGWSGGTTYQRDVRRWVKREKGWKFDSSGVRDRSNGLALNLEGPFPGDDDGDGWEDRERRLMLRLGVGWRVPGLRCTG